MIRKAKHTPRISQELPPKGKALSTLLQRTLQPRAECRSAGVDGEVPLVSARACFLLARRNTEQYHDQAIRFLRSQLPRSYVEFSHYILHSDDIRSLSDLSVWKLEIYD
jgi:hypothetical protein